MHTCVESLNFWIGPHRPLGPMEPIPGACSTGPVWPSRLCRDRIFPHQTPLARLSEVEPTHVMNYCDRTLYIYAAHRTGWPLSIELGSTFISPPMRAQIARKRRTKLPKSNPNINRRTLAVTGVGRGHHGLSCLLHEVPASQLGCSGWHADTTRFCAKFWPTACVVSF